VSTGAILSKKHEKLEAETRLSLETGAVFDGALSRYFRRGLWCMSVMSVLEKCDEGWEERSGVCAGWIIRTTRPTKIFLGWAGFWLFGGLEGWGAEWAF
jgi:hypothetical protein